MGWDVVVKQVAADQGQVDEKSLFMGDNKVSLFISGGQLVPGFEIIPTAPFFCVP